MGHLTALPALYKILVLAVVLSVNFLVLNRRGAGDRYGIVLAGDD